MKRLAIGVLLAELDLATERFPLDPSAFVELAELVKQEGDTRRARQLLIAHDALTAKGQLR